MSLPLPLAKIRTLAQAQQAALIDFTQRIVRIPSLPGQEGTVAAAIQAEMKHLGYDEVWTDEVGNIIGKIVGNGGPTIMLNGHMDHVDPGPPEGWPYPPFSGKIVTGELWGRASVDMKGPVAAMIYGAALFKQKGLTPPGDILMTVPVMEEVGGLGSQHLGKTLQADAAICGEPSSNTLRRGHRGRIGLKVTFKGRSAHASVPHLGRNPHYAAAAFLSQLPGLDMVDNPDLGPATVAPTLYATDQVSYNVIPGEVYLDLDWREVPDEAAPAVVAKIQGLLERTLATGEAEVSGAVKVINTNLTTYTGVHKVFPALFPSYLLAETDPLVQAARTALTEVFGEDRGATIWRFATDGGHLMAAGIPTIGFGPGDETLAHTNQERMNLQQLQEAVVAYAALILALAGGVERAI
jgi:putative selenium metabolism hydrolase